MRENNFPKIWIPSPENRDLRQLLWHRHRLVQMRTRIMNRLQALAMNEGKRRKSKLWSAQGRAELEKLVIIGTTERFQRGRQIGTYVGMIPSEDSSAGKQRLGHISKQGNSLLRFLLVEAAQAAAPSTRIGDVGTCTWRCAVTRALLRLRWGAGWEFACTGCGGMDVSIRHR